jgi:hypothetical protein
MKPLEFSKLPALLASKGNNENYLSRHNNGIISPTASPDFHGTNTVVVVVVVVLVVRSTHNLSQSDCQSVPSLVYFERWENHSASRDHLYLGKTAGTGCARNNVLTCWEVNMGFTVCSPIPSKFNDVDSWKEAVTPCCHCTGFQGDCPLKKKLLKFASHHDDGLTEPCRCQLLWSVRSGANPKQNSKRPSTLDTALDVGLSEENPITSNKKKERAPSVASAIKERVLPYHQPNVPINQVAIGVTQADIDNLETKLLASYEYRLSQYK